MNACETFEILEAIGDRSVNEVYIGRRSARRKAPDSRRARRAWARLRVPAALNADTLCLTITRRLGHAPADHQGLYAEQWVDTAHMAIAAMGYPAPQHRPNAIPTAAIMAALDYEEGTS